MITEIMDPRFQDEPAAFLEPAADSENSDTWWRLSPALLTRHLGVLGFDDVVVSMHEQHHVADGQVYVMPMFTVVAGRAVN